MGGLLFGRGFYSSVYGNHLRPKVQIYLYVMTATMQLVITQRKPAWNRWASVLTRSKNPQLSLALIASWWAVMYEMVSCDVWDGELWCMRWWAVMYEMVSCDVWDWSYVRRKVVHVPWEFRSFLFYFIFLPFRQNEAIYRTALGTVPFELGFIVFSSSIAF